MFSRTSKRQGVVPTLEPIRGRFDEYRLHSAFTEEQALRSSETQIKRHEIRLAALPQKQHRQSTMDDLTCKRGSVGQSEGLSIPRSSVRFRLKPDTLKFS